MYDPTLSSRGDRRPDFSLSKVSTVIKLYPLCYVLLSPVILRYLRQVLSSHRFQKILWKPTVISSEGGFRQNPMRCTPLWLLLRNKEGIRITYTRMRRETTDFCPSQGRPYKPTLLLRGLDHNRSFHTYGGTPLGDVYKSRMTFILPRSSL